MLVAPGQEFQIVHVVVVIARGSQNFKRQVSYDGRSSAEHSGGSFIREEVPQGLRNDQPGGLISRE